MNIFHTRTVPSACESTVFVVRRAVFGAERAAGEASASGHQLLLNSLVVAAAVVVASAGDRERRRPGVVADPSTVNNDVVFSSAHLGRPVRRKREKNRTIK